MPLKVKIINPLATTPTIANEGEDLGYDVYALRQQGQPINEDGTPMAYSPQAPGMPTRMDMSGKLVKPIRIEAGHPTLLETGIAVHFTKSKGKKYGLLVRDRSSVSKKGPYVVAGVIDSGYRGELKIMFNLASGSYFDFWPGDKIAQIVPIEVLADTTEVVDDLDSSTRGDGGFGSSGQ